MGDYAEKEREFISALADETGKDLDDWMAEIAESGLSERNEIIDWLRLQGFAFSPASWLERIHHNGGRLIYSDETSDAPALMHGAGEKLLSSSDPEQGARPPEVNLFRGRPMLRIVSSNAAPAPAATEPIPWRPSAEIAALLAPAKGLQPLAELVLREIVAAQASVRMEAHTPFIVAKTVQPFVALWPQPKALRLYGAFEAGSPFDVRTADSAPKLKAPFAKMILLDDARRIDKAFRALMTAMAARAQS